MITEVSNALAIVPNATVIVTGGSISGSAANSIANQTNGVVTANIVAATASTLVSALINASATDVLSITVSNDSSATLASNLTTLDTKTSVNVTATAVTSVTGTGNEVAALVSANVTMSSNYSALLTGSSSLIDANTVLLDTTGVVTATITTNSVSNLNTGLANASATDVLTLSINDTSISASELITLDGKTSVDIDVSSLNNISGTLSDLNLIYNTGGFTGLGNENITISDTTISSTDLNDIIGETSGSISIGTATINVASGSTLNLSSITSTGTLTINDSSGNENISGTSSNDTLNLNGGNDTVNLGDGSDTVNVNISNLNTNDNITDTGASGTDTLNVNGAGTIDSSALIDVSGFETLKLGSSDNTITFDDTTEFNAFRNEFTDIVDAGGNDTLSFGSIAVTGDLDFSKLSEFENLNLSSTNDNLTLSGDEPSNINGLGGNDQFTLDFSSVKTLNGGLDTDTVKFTGATSTISTDSQFTPNSSFINIEELDISSLSLNTANASTEFEFTDALLQSWTGNATGNLKLSLTSSQAELIKFTDTTSGTERNSYSSGNTGSDISDNTTYDLGNTTLTINLTDV